MNLRRQRSRILAVTACCLLGFATSADAGQFYWTDPTSFSGADLIERANADGSGVQTVVSGLTQPRSIAVDVADQRMYWVDLGAQAIRSVNLDGGGPIQNVVAIDGSGAAGVALDVADGKIYYSNANGDQIHHGGQSGEILRANLNGSSVQTLVSGMVQPGAVAIDLAHGEMYFMELDQKSDGLGSLG